MRKNIEPSLSIYFDLVRFLSAVVVLLSHVWPLLFPHLPLPWPGHAAVVVFFVLSGYVIAFAADNPDQTAAKYGLHRAVRILSVTLPALLLSVAIAPVAGTSLIPNAGSMTLADSEFWRAIWLNVFFLGESWFGNVPPPFNPPFWSLSYEVWYYAIFGAWMFAPRRWRVLSVALTTVAAGPKIAILLPVWLLGVALYRSKITLPPRIALQLFIASTVVWLAFFWFDCSLMIRSHLMGQFSMIKNLHGSNQFLGDYLLGLIVSANFIAAASLGNRLRVLFKIEKPIRYLASFTLSVYLFHMPLTVLIWNGLNVRSVAGFALLLVIGIFVLGSLTERKNKFYRERLEKKLDVGRRPRDIANPEPFLDLDHNPKVP